MKTKTLRNSQKGLLAALSLIGLVSLAIQACNSIAKTYTGSSKAALEIPLVAQNCGAD